MKFHCEDNFEFTPCRVYDRDFREITRVRSGDTVTGICQVFLYDDLGYNIDGLNEDRTHTRIFAAPLTLEGEDDASRRAINLALQKEQEQVTWRDRPGLL